MLDPQILGGFDDLVEIVDDFLMPYKDFVERHEQELRDALSEADGLSIFELTEDGRRAIDDLRALAESPTVYVRTQEIAPLVERIRGARVALVQAQRDKVLRRIDEAVVELRGSTQFKAASESARLRVDAEMERLCAEVNRVSKPGLAEEIGRRLERRVNELYAELIASAAPAGSADADDAAEAQRTAAGRPIIVRLEELLPRTSGVLSTSEQVDEYVERFREQMLAALRDGKQLRN